MRPARAGASALGETRWGRDRRLAARDLLDCARGWHVWALLGVSDVRLRYKRSRFGQFWITLSMAIFVAGIGTVYGGLFHQDVRQYIPYLAVNLTFWTFIQSTVSEGCQAFVDAAAYLRQENLPKSTFVMRVLVRNAIALAHNVVLIPVIFLAFGHGVGPVALLALPGLALVTVGLFEAALCLALLCTRFRDMPQIVGNLLQLAFFVTPVMWHLEQLGDRAAYVQVLNPFASFLRVVTEPLLGNVPSGATYLTVGISLAVLSAVAWPCLARFRSRVVYWL